MEAVRKSGVMVRGFAGLALVVVLGVAGVASPVLARQGPIELIEQANANAVVDSDPVKAFSLIRRAAATGDATALDALGVYLKFGIGGTPDAEAAADYFRQSAVKGHPVGQWRLGMALLEGDGVRMDPAEAWTWVKRSAEGGYINGQISAAVMLAVGQGVQEDDVAARGWYRRAAEKGSAHALRGLAYMMLTGEGGPVDALTGQAYAEMAREGGDENAGPMLEGLGKTLSVEDRRKAEEIKIDWKRRYGDPR